MSPRLKIVGSSPVADAAKTAAIASRALTNAEKVRRAMARIKAIGERQIDETIDLAIKAGQSARDVCDNSTLAPGDRERARQFAEQAEAYVRLAALRGRGR